ncbi:hypothetical protein Tco_1046949 [Tanacetum coccineum]
MARRVESSEDEGLGEEDASKQGRIADTDADMNVTLVNDDVLDEDMFGVNGLDGDEVIVDNEDVVKTADEEMTLAQTLMEIKSTTTKAKRIVMEEPKPQEPKKKKDQIKFDEELAFKLQAEEARLASEREQQQEEANIALINTWDDIQARIDADGELAARL